MRFALGVEYDGSDFAGWQRQADARSVQQALEAALGRVADAAVTVVCAGRTDAGVHALGQVVHFDTPAVRSERAWVLGTNTYLPAGIAVRWVRQVSADFHARFCARKRHYRYLLLNRVARPGLLSRRAGWCCRPLDLGAMQAAAQHLHGEHDFSSFRAAACQARHPVRHIYRLDVARVGELIVFDVEANAFLHHMVRNIVGVLIEIGRGDQAPDWAAAVLAARDRRVAGVTAAAGGLYFVEVSYPHHFGLPSPAVPAPMPLF